jgi:hypothetical protein
MASVDRELFFDVLLRKGSDVRTWRIGPSILVHQVFFRRSEPGSVTSGGLPTQEAVQAKRREFEAEIAAARADGWR